MSGGVIARPGTTAPEVQVQRYTYPERAYHWVNGMAYTYLLLTGLALFTPYLYWLAAVLGGGGTIRFWHPWVGLVYLVTIFWMHSKWKSDMGAHANDQKWKDNIKNYIQNRDEMVPAQERFNAGQKQFWWAMFYSTIILLITGVVMWIQDLILGSVPPSFVGVAHWLLTLTIFLHSVTALVTIAAFIIHVYMSVWMTPGSVKAMTDGKVPAAWARTHHRLWYERITGRKG